MKYDWKYNIPNHCYILIVLGCTGYEAKQLINHPLLDTKTRPFHNTFTERFEAYLRRDMVSNVDELADAIRWIKDDVLARHETITHDWSSYLEKLVAA